MERIKYIVSYDLESNKHQNRLNILASANKINYIISVLNDLGYGVDIISTSQTLNRKCYKGSHTTFGVNTIRRFPTTWRGGTLLKVINVLVMRFFVLMYLILNVTKYEKIIIYHSIGNLWMLPILRKIKKAYIIEEVEEIYGDIFGKPRMSQKEKSKLQNASAYIYPTKLLNSIVNIHNKPFLVVHGAYKNNSNEYYSDQAVEEKSYFETGIYHIGYTGILDPKKGCLNILKAAKYLDSTYHIHILGFGGDEEVQMVIKIVENYTADKNIECKVSYDGIRRGDAYTNYLKHLDLGICPVDASQSFINTQFPSKIITYLVAGLPVICSEAETVMTSDIAEAIIFYSGNRPEDIAKAIISSREDMSTKDPSKILEQCDRCFRIDLFNILKND